MWAEVEATFRSIYPGSLLSCLAYLHEATKREDNIAKHRMIMDIADTLASKLSFDDVVKIMNEYFMLHGDYNVGYPF